MKRKRRKANEQDFSILNQLSIEWNDDGEPFKISIDQAFDGMYKFEGSPTFN